MFLAALHLAVIFFIPWTSRVPAVVIAPSGMADLYLMLWGASVVGKFMERPASQPGRSRFDDVPDETPEPGSSDASVCRGGRGFLFARHLDRLPEPGNQGMDNALVIESEPILAGSI